MVSDFTFLKNALQMITNVQMNCIYLEIYFLPQNKNVHSHNSLTVAPFFFTRNTVWPSPAGISSFFSVQPAAALPLGYWCSAPSVQSLLSEEKYGEDNQVEIGLN